MKKKLFFMLVVFILILAVFSCEEETPITGPTGNGGGDIISDTTPPAFTVLPTVTTNETTAVVMFTMDEQSSVYWLCRPASQPGPGSAAIQASNTYVAANAGSPASFTISGLTGSTEYAVYFIAVDSVMNYSSLISNTFTTSPVGSGDVVPPVFSSGPMVSSTPGETSANILVTVNEDGTLYTLCLPAVATAPDAAAVVASNQSESCTGGIQNSVAVTNLSADTAYTVYMVAEDTSGNRSSVGSVSFTTATAVADPEILKMYTETTYPNSSDFDCNPAWPVWSGAGSFTISTETTLTGEGSESMRCNLVTGSSYWGTSIHSASANEDLSRFSGGYLKFKLMVPVGITQAFKVGIQTGTSYPSTIDYVVNPFDHGLTADGNWHDITLSISGDLGVPDSGTYSLQKVNNAWIIAGSASPTINTYVYYDDVRWEAGP